MSEQQKNAVPNPATIIAAFESNHNGNLSLAKRMVDDAVECGCDAIKLPVCSVRDRYTGEILQQPAYRYPELGPTYGAVLENLELSTAALSELRSYCRDRITFIGAPYDMPSLDVLEALDVDAYQIDPPILYHQPLLARLDQRQADVLVCAGMCGELEIESALKTLSNSRTKLLHCVMGENLRLEDTALSFIPYLGRRFGCEVGYLGFETGIEAAFAAYALGATIIEKRFTIDHDLSGPGHKQSLDRDDLRTLVRELRGLEQSLNATGPRQFLPVELDVFTDQRCSLVTAMPLKAGTAIQPEILIVKSSLRGLSPQLLERITGKRLLYDLPADAPITFGVLEP